MLAPWNRYGSELSGEVVHELVGTRWALHRLGNEAVTMLEGGREPFIALQAGGKVLGYGGCNRIAASYELEGSRLRFGQVVSTRMFCPDNEIEETLLHALDATVRWQLCNSQLDLQDAHGVTVVSFVARDL
jgi:putative lipoprotein